MTEIPMIREGNRLVCASPISEELMQEVSASKELLVTVKTPRNMRQFKMAWALADIVSKSCDWLPDRETAMNWMKIKARHVTMISNPVTGQVAIIPKSIAFASLKQDAFKRVFDRMIYVVTAEIIPGLEESSLRSELESMVGMDPIKLSSKRKTKNAQTNDASEAPEGRASQGHDRVPEQAYRAIAGPDSDAGGDAREA